MERFYYIKNAIAAYQHENKLLLSGKKKASELPDECIPGILYHYLNKLLDMVCLQYDIQDKIEEIDEMAENYYFDIHFNVLSEADKKMYGVQKLKKAIRPLWDAMSYLQNAADGIGQGVDDTLDITEQLFSQLFIQEENAKAFFGGEDAWKRGVKLWESGEFMDELMEAIYEFSGTEKDSVEQLMDELTK